MVNLALTVLLYYNSSDRASEFCYPLHQSWHISSGNSLHLSSAIKRDKILILTWYENGKYFLFLFLTYNRKKKEKTKEIIPRPMWNM